MRPNLLNSEIRFHLPDFVHFTLRADARNLVSVDAKIIARNFSSNVARCSNMRLHHGNKRFRVIGNANQGAS